MSPETSDVTRGTGDLPKRYLVTCDDCSFDEEARGRDEAVRRAQRHRDETDHSVVVVEFPPNRQPS